eukprot:254690-Rhodomonas_salina.1
MVYYCQCQSSELSTRTEGHLLHATCARQPNSSVPASPERHHGRLLLQADAPFDPNSSSCQKFSGSSMPLRPAPTGAQHELQS